MLLITVGIVGFSAGLAGHRLSLDAYLMVVLIALLVFVIVDLDRPRRGLITVSQDSPTDLQASIQAMEAADSP